jgi:hypothetical protein
MSRAIPVTVVVACVVLAACGGKTALEGSEPGSGQGGSGASSSGASSSGASGRPGPAPAPSPAPTPTTPPTPAPSPGRPGAECPATPPSEGADCGWQYGIPCDYTVPRSGNTCAIQCICVGKYDDTANRWTCFDLGCDEG